MMLRVDTASRLQPAHQEAVLVLYVLSRNGDVTRYRRVEVEGTAGCT